MYHPGEVFFAGLRPGERVRAMVAEGVRAGSLLFLVLPFVTACGGSSSETPPPLEPDPQLLAPRVPEDEGADAPAGPNQKAASREAASPNAAVPNAGDELQPPPAGMGARRLPARSTWGSGAPATKTRPPELAPVP
jgi:hypothetical protein